MYFHSSPSYLSQKLPTVNYIPWSPQPYSHKTEVLLSLCENRATTKFSVIQSLLTQVPRVSVFKHIISNIDMSEHFSFFQNLNLKYLQNQFKTFSKNTGSIFWNKNRSNKFKANKILKPRHRFIQSNLMCQKDKEFKKGCPIVKWWSGKA